MKKQFDRFINPHPAPDHPQAGSRPKGGGVTLSEATFGFPKLSPSPAGGRWMGARRLSAGKSVAPFSFCVIALCALAVSSLAQPAKNAFDEDPGNVKAVPVLSLGEAWQKLPSYKFGDSLAPLKTIEKAVAASPKTAAQQSDLATKLGALLENQNSTRDARKFSCRQLAIVGQAAQVPGLKKLLLGNDDDLAFFARFALERIPDAAALHALRNALTQTQGERLAGVLDSLGVRRDTASVNAIAKVMQGADETTMRSGLNALGHIGGLSSLKALEQIGFAENSPLLSVAQVATLRAADSLLQSEPTRAASVYKNIWAANPKGAVRVASWRGLVKTSGETAMPLVLEALKSNDKSLQAAAVNLLPTLPKGALFGVVHAIPSLPEGSQVLALQAVSHFGLPVVREAALQSLKSTDENVRVAALGALAASGDVSTIGVLTKAAGDGAGDGAIREKAAAQNSLERLRGETIDAALIANMEKASPNEKVVLAKALGNRRAPNATPALLKAAGDVEANVRLAAIEALAQAAQPNDVPILLELQAKALNADKRELLALEKTMIAAVLNGSDKEAALNSVLIVAKDAAPIRKTSLLRVVGAVGGVKANAALIEAAKDTDETIRDAGIRALSASLDQNAAPALLELAHKAVSPTHKVLAFRGYVRLANDKALKTSERLKMYEKALAVAPAGEKKSVLGGLGNIGNADALKLVAPLLNDETLREEASAGVNAIATKMLAGKVSDQDKDPLRNALKKVVEVSKNDASRKQATEHLNKLG